MDVHNDPLSEKQTTVKELHLTCESKSTILSDDSELLNCSNPVN